MIKYDELWVCPACKLLFVQKIKEGVDVVPKFKRAVGWKIFFFIILVLELYSIPDSIQHIINGERLLIHILELIVYPFVLVALFGFSFNKRILKRAAWKLLFPVTVITDIIGMVVEFKDLLHGQDALIIATLIFIIMTPLLIFQYIALYKYGFSKTEPWV